MHLAPRYKQNNTKSSSKGMYYYYKRQKLFGRFPTLKRHYKIFLCKWKIRDSEKSFVFFIYTFANEEDYERKESK